MRNNYKSLDVRLYTNQNWKNFQFYQINCLDIRRSMSLIKSFNTKITTAPRKYGGYST